MQVWSTIKTILANKKPLKKGFTLVELLVVIVILGVLATLGIISITKIISSSKEKIFANEAIAFINAAKTKSAEAIVPDEGLCYSISDLAEYVEKDVVDYSGSVFVSGDNKYKIWVSKNSYIINAGIIDDMDVVTVDGEIDASSVCPSSFISIVVNASGGTWSGDLQDSGYEGQQIDLTGIEEPVKAGYVFSGWTASGEGSSITNNILTIGSETATLIANWTANSFTLTINAAGGTYSGTNPITVTFGQTATINPPIKATYNFTGWTVVGVGSSIVGTTFTMGSENATLIANWSLSSFTLTVDANGGTWGGTTPQTIQSGASTSITIDPIKSGYVFNGWTVGGAGSTLVGTTFTMGHENATLTANWLSYANMYTYTGTSTAIDDTNYNWRIKFLTSGTFTPLVNLTIDVFIVGAGGGGGSGTAAGSGGGGGYTGTWSQIVLNKNQAYSIVVGSGGGPNAAGGLSSGFGYSKNGGSPGSGAASYSWQNTTGGAGGSGGGGNGAYTASIYRNAGNGGLNGSNGSPGSDPASAGGAGQGTSTEEFGVTGATRYGAGGGGGCHSSARNAGIGGATGGANGYGLVSGVFANATSGTANTGGGGGGASDGGGGGAGSGGSGIVIIRNYR